MRTLGSLIASALLLAACASPTEERPDPDVRTVPRASDDPAGPLPRCPQEIPAGASVAPLTLSAPDGSTLSAASFGDGETAIVLLHQISRDGVCSWIPFALSAAERGLTALAIDMCGWGESECTEAFHADPPAQVRAAVDHLRQGDPDRRVVVVGASMGGSRAVLAAGSGVPVDAYVDVSGPSTWDDRRLLDVADALDVPGLLVYARSDSVPEFDAARRLARRSGARFVEAESGHGYDILNELDGRLSRIGKQVLRFAEG